MKHTTNLENLEAITAFYSDSYASYARVENRYEKIWRVRTKTNNVFENSQEVIYPGSKFKDIESFIGYCKLKHSEICTGG